MDRRRRLQLQRQRDTLLQEKEATLGFVNNVGEVFTETENVDMDALLSRVLHYAVRTCKAGSGAIYLANPRTCHLEARSISGVFPPPFEIDSSSFDSELNTAQDLVKCVENTPIKLGMGLIGEAAVLGNSVLVEDAELDSRVPQMAEEFLKVRTLLVVPMRFGNTHHWRHDSGQPDR